MDSLQGKGQRFNATTAANSVSAGSATATQAAPANAARAHFITEISGSSPDATAVIRAYSGNTTYWQDRMGSVAYLKTFKTPIAVSAGSAVSVEVLMGGAAGSVYVNIAGYTI